MSVSTEAVASVSSRKVDNFATLKLLFKRKIVLIGTIFIIFFLILAIFGPWIAPNDPYEQNRMRTLEKPSTDYLLGTDLAGRCLLSRIIYGARTSLVIGLIVVGFASVVGMSLGMIAGFYGKWLGTVIMRIMDAMLAFPMLVLALFIASLLGPGIFNVVVALGVGLVPTYARLMFGQSLSIKENDYILAARAMGLSRAKIMFSHMLPNCLPPLIVQMALMLGATILAEAGLSFLGIGIRPPIIAWGAMVSAGQGFLKTYPLLSFAPGLCIMVVVFGFNMVGDGLRDLLDPRLKGLL